jgi:hypothetical protein
MTISLARRLADFFDQLDPRPFLQAPREPNPDREKRQLSRQLLGTLSREMLAATGHLKKPVVEQPIHRGRVRLPHRLPQPRPVGDLSRPRLGVV